MPSKNMRQMPFHPYQYQYNQQPFQSNSFPFNQSANYPPDFFANKPSQTGTQVPHPQQSTNAQQSGWNPQQQGGGPSAQQQFGGNQPKPSKGFISYFQDKDGQMDLDKMLNTASQVANTYHQFTPIFKGISSFVKGVK
ncbi:hypothetical protein J2T56_001029 [Natronobacillus azotifigens]|uniref:YppG family protein n=1 Tax=Natronobacillus azotifigens TaxID=472978 RepID=A0A9J6RBF6_9BACI|nr:YppG family protein [Natronobacillus azotifigens]MCZ0702694.1 YppG family protein [Natronobacillus azotifigens]